MFLLVIFHICGELATSGCSVNLTSYML